MNCERIFNRQDSCFIAESVDHALDFRTASCSQQHQLQQALKVSEDKFEKVFSKAPVWISITDMQTARYLEVNEQLLLSSGFSREEMIGHSSVEIGWITAEDRSRIVSGIDARGRVVSMEIPFRTKDGRLVYGLLNGEKMIIAGKESLLSITVDITERKIADEALRLRMQEKRLLFENMNSAFAYHQMVFDSAGAPKDYVFLEINPAFSKHTGLSRDILGKKVTEVIAGIEQSTPDFIGIYGKVARTGESCKFDCYHEELRRWYSISAYSPQPGYFATIFDDITERKKLDWALREADRNSKMFMQRIMAAREEEKQRLSVDLHDEIGTMAVALGAELNIIEAQLKMFGNDAALAHLGRTKELLRQEVEVFRKMAYGLRPPNLDVVGLHGVLREYFAEMGKTHHLTTRFTAGRMVKVEGKIAISLYRITQEVITNIVKHSKATTVMARLVYKEGKLIYTISDDGQGFNVEQTMGSMKVNRMGLWGMKERAEAMDAQLEVESVPGKGTTVKVRVPYCSQEAKV